MFYFETKDNITISNGAKSLSVTFKRKGNNVNIIRQGNGSYKVDTVSLSKATDIRAKLQNEKFKADEYMVCLGNNSIAKRSFAF